jgi:hypothetical protein
VALGAREGWGWELRVQFGAFDREILYYWGGELWQERKIPVKLKFKQTIVKRLSG